MAGLLGLVSPSQAKAQLQVDTVFTWRGYTRPATCHLRIYTSPTDDARPHTVLIRELAENAGGSTVSDARHLVELIGRRFAVDPAEAHWVFHWGAFSYAGATPDRRKELFLRATFRWNKERNPQHAVVAGHHTGPGRGVHRPAVSVTSPPRHFSKSSRRVCVNGPASKRAK